MIKSKLIYIFNLEIFLFGNLKIIIEFVFRILGIRFIDVLFCKNYFDKLFNEIIIIGFEGYF